MSVNEKMASIADAIRDKTGGTSPLSLDDMASEITEVYKNGVDKGESDFWDAIQGVGGKRTTYDCGFKAWRAEYIRPKYKVVPTRSPDANLRYVFESAFNLKKIEKEYFDFSYITFNTSASNTQSLYGFFRFCEKIEEIEDIGLGAGGYYQTFNKCYKLHTIEVMRCVKEGTYSGTFTQCYELQNITIEGVIGNSITFGDCSKLTIESLRSIISALYDYSDEGVTKTLTLHKNAYDRTPSELREEAKGKGWTMVVI